MSINHFVYSEFLKLFSLTDKHKKQLLDRGFSESQIIEIGFKTFPAEGIPSPELTSFRSFIEASGYSLDEVAGFYKVEGIKAPRIMKPFIIDGGKTKKAKFVEAIIIPVRDADSKITSLKFRVETDNTNQKYLYFSSKGKLSGKAVEITPHYSFFKQSGDQFWSMDTIRVTEGEFKAEIATLKTDIYTISMGGVSNWKAVAKSLEVFKELKTVHIAPDSDYKASSDPYTGEPLVTGNNSVGKAFVDLRRMLLKKGYKVIFEDWDEDLGKGIDDLLMAGGEINHLNDKELEELEENLSEPDFPHKIKMKSGFKLLNTIENFVALCDFLKISFAYNAMNHRKELIGDKAHLYNPTNLDVAISKISSRGVLYGMNVNSFAAYSDTVAADNSYHPARRWIESKKWDGVDRYELLIDTLRVPFEWEENKELYLRKWLTSGIAALYAPNYWTKIVLVLVGEGSLGKTSWFNKLFEPLGQNAFKDGIILDPSNKDSRWNIVSHWCLELGEIGSTFKKADMDELKACITERSDYMRKPYGREPMDYPRQCFFGASVDRFDFLNDEAGSVRFACLPLDSINFQHDIDIQQLWAEIKEKFYDKGETWYIDYEQTQELKDSNESFSLMNEEAEILERAYGSRVRCESQGYRMLMASEVNDELLTMGYISKRINARALGRELAKMFKKKAKSKNTNVANRYQLPPIREMGGSELELVNTDKIKEKQSATDEVIFPETI